LPIFGALVKEQRGRGTEDAHPMPAAAPMRGRTRSLVWLPRDFAFSG
jgi:hypothetical protein